MTNSSDRTAKKYSIVVPVYNSSESLEELCNRINNVFLKIDKEYEIILVDDCSIDNSWEIMEKLHNSNVNIKIFQLMKNFGQHNAIICGFNYVSGDYVITMDDDLQNPPEEILNLIDKIHQGYDAVIGAIEQKKHSLFKNISSLIIRYLVTKIFNKPKELKLSSFRIMKKEIADQIKILKTPYPYLSGMLLSITRNIVNVTVKHDYRKYGSSTYSMGKLIKLSFNLILNYSSLPLQILSAFGILISLLSFIIGLFFIIKKLIVGIDVPGWTTVICLSSFFNGLLIFMLSIIGEYLVRIINETSNQQQFIVRKKFL